LFPSNRTLAVALVKSAGDGRDEYKGRDDLKQGPKHRHVWAVTARKKWEASLGNNGKDADYSAQRAWMHEVFLQITNADATFTCDDICQLCRVYAEIGVVLL
jgi:hypothetical protein